MCSYTWIATYARTVVSVLLCGQFKPDLDGKYTDEYILSQNELAEPADVGQRWKKYNPIIYSHNHKCGVNIKVLTVHSAGVSEISL